MKILHVSLWNSNIPFKGNVNKNRIYWNWRHKQQNTYTFFSSLAPRGNVVFSHFIFLNIIYTIKVKKPYNFFLFFQDSGVKRSPKSSSNTSAKKRKMEENGSSPIYTPSNSIKHFREILNRPSVLDLAVSSFFICRKLNHTQILTYLNFIN